MIDDKRLPLKLSVIDYLTHFPFYKWAAKSIGRDEDTLIIWRKEDSDFSDKCEVAKSEAIKKLGKRATPDFMLKCADPKTFNIVNKTETEIKLPTPILNNLNGVSNNDGNKEDKQT